MTDRKHVGSMNRSRALPRRIRCFLVDRSSISHFLQTNDATFRVLVSATAASMFESITSGKSCMVVVEMAVEVVAVEVVIGFSPVVAVEN